MSDEIECCPSCAGIDRSHFGFVMRTYDTRCNNGWHTGAKARDYRLHTRKWYAALAVTGAVVLVCLLLDFVFSGTRHYLRASVGPSREHTNLTCVFIPSGVEVLEVERQLSATVIRGHRLDVIISDIFFRKTGAPITSIVGRDDQAFILESFLVNWSEHVFHFGSLVRPQTDLATNRDANSGRFSEVTVMKIPSGFFPKLYLWHIILTKPDVWSLVFLGLLSDSRDAILRGSHLAIGDSQLFASISFGFNSRRDGLNALSAEDFGLVTHNAQLSKKQDEGSDRYTKSPSSIRESLSFKRFEFIVLNDANKNWLGFFLVGIGLVAVRYSSVVLLGHNMLPSLSDNEKALLALLLTISGSWSAFEGLCCLSLLCS